ncbi:T9SS type A sorting domain-containing protein [Flavobacterium sp.]|uniref:T9SS type A sorting domain-containing protein n=1 Tax=Flavobacterium sp. TaxID=239 RepID=UPI0025B8067E|nr:T9SS type A sorting domain-containing protein [Flavobacterium sp.]MBA4276555.1 hypothetical protein [Flavobacterium sp.]
MKKLYTLSFILLASLSFGQTIPFTGTGALTANGWTLHSGTTAGQLTILTTASDSGSSLSFTGLAASTGNRTSVIAGNSEDDNYPTTSALTGTIYYSALIKAVDNTGMNLNTSAGDYSLSLGGSAGSTISNLPARIYVRQGSAVNTFNIGILNNSGGTVAPSYIATDFAVSTTYFVVVKFVIATNTASIYINPTPGAVEPTATATNASGTTTAPASILSICIRQGGNATTGTGNVEIDEIRVGSDWASVTPAAPLSVKQNKISGLNVYPNPVTNGTLYISSDSASAKSVEIYDILGKQVLNAKTSNNAVNVSNLKGGAYIVKITEEGKTDTRKLIIE